MCVLKCVTEVGSPQIIVLHTSVELDTRTLSDLFYSALAVRGSRD